MEDNEKVLSIDASKGLSELIKQRERFIDAIIELNKIKNEDMRDVLYSNFDEQILHVDNLISKIIEKMTVICYTKTENYNPPHINN